MLLGRDHLVHVGSQPGVQRRPAGLALLHHGCVLARGLSQDLLVHGVRDLRRRGTSISLEFGYSVSQK